MARPATGSIVEREGAQGTTYAARFRAYGERQYVTLGHSRDGYTSRRAETELQNIPPDVRRGIWKPEVPEPHTPPADPTFHEFASSWYEDHRHEVAQRTAEDYQWALSNHLLPFFAKHRLSQITIAKVDRYRAAKVREREQRLVGRALSNTSINATLNQLAQILELAGEYGQITFNSARGRRRRLKADAPRRSWLEPEQVKPLLDAAVHVRRGGHTVPDTRLRASSPPRSARDCAPVNSSRCGGRTSTWRAGDYA
jgi:integrase